MNRFILILAYLSNSESFLVPVFTASNGSRYLHSTDKLSSSIRTAIDDVRTDFNVELNVSIIESDCAPDVTVNKAVRIVTRGWEDPEKRPVALVGFTCDTEHKTFGSLAGKWKVPLITAGMRRIMGDISDRKQSGWDTTVRTGINAEIIGNFISDLFSKIVFDRTFTPTGVTLLHVENSNFGYPVSEQQLGDCHVYMLAIARKIKELNNSTKNKIEFNVINIISQTEKEFCSDSRSIMDAIFSTSRTVLFCLGNWS